jgi:HEAT repeat protein
VILDPSTLLGWLAGSAVVAAAAGAFGLAQRRGRAAGLRTVAARAGVKDLRIDRGGTLTGRRGHLVVRIRGTLGFARTAVHVLVSGLWADLRMSKPEGPWGWSPASGLELGDPDLDPRILLAGPPLGTRALFDAVTREKTREVMGIEPAIRVEGGELSVAFQESVGTASPFEEGALSAVLDLARRLRAPDTPLSRLAQIGHSDPLPTVRALALRTLVEEAPEREETRVALRAGTSDTEPRIRLQAARGLGAEGAPALLAMAADHRVDDACGADAIAALGEGLPASRAREILEWTAATGHVGRARAALPTLVREGPAAAPFLVALLARSPAPVAAVAAEGLGAIASPVAEPALLTALGSEEASLACAAAAALGRLATVRAVPALKDAERRGGALRSAARAAIASIQSRLPGASPGQVSLADGDAGAVSIADTADGRVSLRSDDPPTD